MAHIEEFISRVANRASWEVRYTGPDRAFVFTSSEWEALEAERRQEIQDDELWNDRVKLWHGNGSSKELNKKKKQEGQTTLDGNDNDNDDDDEDSI